MASLKEIAASSGVSARTVSAVLNNRGGTVRVSESTRKRVIEAAQKLKYIPNVMAQGLRSGKSCLMGFITCNVTVSFIPEVIQGVEDILLENNYSMLLNTYKSHDDLKAVIESMKRKKVDAIIVIASESPDQGKIIKEAAGDVPVVFVGHDRGNNDIPSIHCDCGEIIRKAVSHLSSLGHKNIAYLEGHCSERLAAYKAMIPQEFQQIIQGGYSFKSAKTAFDECCANNTLPSAVVAFSDQAAAGFICAAIEKGYRVPDDISVVGIDDIDIASMLSPSLTTVAQPKAQLGKNAASLALKMIAGEIIAPHFAQILPSKIIVRGSTNKFK